jgi:hypothetical protein
VKAYLAQSIRLTIWDICKPRDARYSLDTRFTRVDWYGCTPILDVAPSHQRQVLVARSVHSSSLTSRPYFQTSFCSKRRRRQRTFTGTSTITSQGKPSDSVSMLHAAGCAHIHTHLLQERNRAMSPICICRPPHSALEQSSMASTGLRPRTLSARLDTNGQ